MLQLKPAEAEETGRNQSLDAVFYLAVVLARFPDPPVSPRRYRTVLRSPGAPRSRAFSLSEREKKKAASPVAADKKTAAQPMETWQTGSGGQPRRGANRSVPPPYFQALASDKAPKH